MRPAALRRKTNANIQVHPRGGGDRTFSRANPYNLPGKQILLEGGITINPVHLAKPSDDHYPTHLTKHSACEACQNCKVRRKARRDKDEAERKLPRRECGYNTHNAEDFPELRDLQKQPKEGAPIKFGDQVTSDSIIVL